MLHIIHAILTIAERIIDIMRKFQQIFTCKTKQYKLNETTDTLIKLDEEIDAQEVMNSHYDETMFYNLERFFEARSVQILDGLDEVDTELNDLTGCKADAMLRALERVGDLRIKYNIPQTYTDREVMEYLRNKAKGGAKDGKKIEQESESQKLPQVQQEDTQA